jgi:hypothetical protein
MSIKPFRLFLVFLPILLIAFVWTQKDIGDITTQDLCDLNADLLTEGDTWQINESSVPSEIRWQKAEPFPRPIVHLGSPNTGIVATSSLVLYWQTDVP